jgi:hypothetical protein
MPELDQCVECGIVFEWCDEPNVCMSCGEPLCPHCYHESSYCADCEHNRTHYGTCIACERLTIVNDSNMCEGCVLQAMIEAREA